MREGLLEAFNLKREIVERMFNAQVGWANIWTKKLQASKHSKKKQELLMGLAATSWRFAGTLALFNNDFERGGYKEHFRKSYELYGQIKLPYSLLIRSCYEPYDMMLEFMRIGLSFWLHHEDTVNDRELIILEQLGAEQLIYLYFFSSIYEEPRNVLAQRERELLLWQRIKSIMELNKSLNFGILNFQIRDFLKLAKLLRNAHQQQAQLGDLLFRVLSCYEDAIHSAMRDDYHWQRLMLPVLPLDPDVLGFLKAIEVVLWKNFSLSFSNLLELDDLSPISKATIEVVERY